MQDVKDEENAINLYKKIVEQARKEGDETTNRLFREILQQEEDHHDTFTTLLEDL
jgi:bacterioferritin